MMKHSTQSRDLKTTQSSTHIPWWIYLIVIVGALLTVTGAIISKVDPAMLTNDGTITDAVRVYADYLFARNLPLALMLLLLLTLRARPMLAGFMVLTALIQIVDVTNDLIRGDLLIVPGLLVFAMVFLLGAWRLFGQPLWRVDAWRAR
ncbi:MAG TPA: hypothetical protein VKR06_07575 [Ktedonosporobacter sp.]|nr:hypothetical protein [Ktedonosporobacter sp.]